MSSPFPTPAPPFPTPAPPFPPWLPLSLPDLQEKISWLLAQRKDLTIQVQELQRQNQDLQDQVPPGAPTGTPRPSRTPPPGAGSSLITLLIPLLPHSSLPSSGQILREARPRSAAPCHLPDVLGGWAGHGGTPQLSGGLSGRSWRWGRGSSSACGQPWAPASGRSSPSREVSGGLGPCGHVPSLVAAPQCHQCHPVW